MKKYEWEFNKKLIIVLGVLVLLALILFIVLNNIRTDYNTYKIDSDKGFVYTKYSSNKSESKVPFINLVGNDAKKVNNQIVNLSQEYLTNKNNSKTVTYRYNRSKNLLSVVLIFRDYSDGKLDYNFKTFVLDLKDNVKLLTDEEIKSLFNYTDTDIKVSMTNDLKRMYDQEVNKGYFNPSQCGFSSCYLGMRGMYSLLDNANYYVENSNLVVYRSFIVYTMYHEERYFTRNDFKFVIKK